MNIVPFHHDDARCAQRGIPPEVFYPTRGMTFEQQKHDINEARRCCRKCLVRLECLDFALANNEKWGIWGGLTERERRIEKARRRRNVA